MELKIEFHTGYSKTHGVLPGEKEDTSKLEEQQAGAESVEFIKEIPTLFYDFNYESKN